MKNVALCFYFLELPCIRAEKITLECGVPAAYCPPLDHVPDYLARLCADELEFWNPAYFQDMPRTFLLKCPYEVSSMRVSVQFCNMPIDLGCFCFIFNDDRPLLTDLDLSCSTIGCSDAVHIANTCFNLRRVAFGIGCYPENDRQLAALLKLPRLETLALENNTWRWNEHLGQSTYCCCSELVHILNLDILAGTALKTLKLNSFTQDEVNAFLDLVGATLFAVEVGELAEGELGSCRP